MIRAVPYTPAHMDFCDFAAPYDELAKREDPEALARSREAWTILDGNGTPVAIFGAVETHPRVLYVWGFIGKGSPFALLEALRFARTWLATLDFVRCETAAPKAYSPGYKLLRFLGFRRETSKPMKKWDGVSDFHLFSMVRA